MRLVITSLSLILLLSSCTSSSQKKEKSFRVMLSFISDKVDQKLLRQAIIDKFGEIGVVHTPDHTSLEKMLAAQEQPFAVLTVDLREITTSDYKKTFPIISLSCRMYEEVELMLNKQQTMGNIWERLSYIEILSDQKSTTNAVDAEFDKLLQEFSDSYYQINSKLQKPQFYIGNVQT